MGNAVECGCCRASANGANSDIHEVNAVVSQRPSKSELDAGLSGMSRQCTPEHVTPDGGIARSIHQTKQGGFGIKNFCPINSGHLEDVYECEKCGFAAGGFGSVRRGTEKRTGIVFAVKSLQKDDLEDDQVFAKFNEEIEIMRLVDHPNIIRFRESFEDFKQIHLVLEYCAGGDLLDTIESDVVFTEHAASRCIRQMLLALNYLHHNHIAHRDIKPENWLFATKGSTATAKLKLIDFGFAKCFTPGVLFKTQCGTPFYVAPEVLKGEYDERADVWSLGVVVYMILSGTLPFVGKTDSIILEAVNSAEPNLSGKDWVKITKEAKSCIKACLQRDLGLRPSAQDMLADPWIIHAQAAASETSKQPLIDVSNLKAYSSMSKVKKAALTVIATQLTDDNIEQLREQFMEMDNNSDGTLSVQEIREGISRLNCDVPLDLDKLLGEVDSDGSGAIDYTEFLAATLDKKLYYQKDVVWRAFKRFDADGSGTISKKELSNILIEDEFRDALNLDLEADDEVTRLFDSIDLDKDGTIDFDEFFAMVRADNENKRRRNFSTRSLQQAHSLHTTKPMTQSLYEGR